MKLGPLGVLSLKEIELVSELPQFSSLRALSRSRQVEAAQITRSLQKIEATLGTILLERAHSGIQLTHEGLRLANVAQKILSIARELRQDYRINSERELLTVGSRGFLNHVFAPLLVQAHASRQSKVNDNFTRRSALRFLDMSPEELKVAEHKRLIQIAIHMGEMEWTQSWESSYAGKLFWSAFVRPSHPIIKQQKIQSGPQPESHESEFLKISDLRNFEFVGPSYWMGAEIKEGEDGFPLSLNHRNVSIYAQSAVTAIEIAKRTDAIVFAPNIVSESPENTGTLARLKVEGTENCFQKVYLSVRTDAISKAMRDDFLEIMKEVLL